MTFTEMEAIALPCDYLFQWNHDPGGEVVEELTHGPSHVILLAKFQQSQQWFEFEAMPLYGCRVLPLSHYAEYESRMALCRRKSAFDPETVMQLALEALGRKYDFREEVEDAWRIITKHGRVVPTNNTMFCSGYVAYCFGNDSNPTPIQLLQNPETEVIGWVN